MLTRARPKQASGGFFLGYQLLAKNESTSDSLIAGNGSLVLKIILYSFLPFALSLENELYRVAEGAFASGVGSDVVGF